MDGFKKFLYRFIYPACVIFTILTLAFYIISAKTSTDSATKNYAVLMIFVFVYGCIISLFNQVLFTKINVVLKTLIHYVLVVTTIFIFFLIEKDFFSSSSIWSILIGFTVLYWIVALPIVISKLKKKNKILESKEYKKIK